MKKTLIIFFLFSFFERAVLADEPVCPEGQVLDKGECVCIPAASQETVAPSVTSSATSKVEKKEKKKAKKVEMEVEKVVAPIKATTEAGEKKGEVKPQEVKLEVVPPSCPSPTPIILPEICSGGADEDGDGKVDCADADCHESPICIPQPPPIPSTPTPKKKSWCTRNPVGCGFLVALGVAVAAGIGGGIGAAVENSSGGTIKNTVKPAH